MTQRNSFNFQLNGLAGLVFLLFFLFGLYLLIQGIYTILYYAAPVLIIGALIFDYQTVLNFGKWLLTSLRDNPILGIGAVLLTFFAFPFVSAFLFAKSLFKKKIRDISREQDIAANGQFIEYEEVEDVEIETLELPPLKKKTPAPKKTDTSEYDQLFED
ncbi:MAG: hypothetical protein D6714_05860 [Bacteroidetes bacterium]|nr:MAG: hypothetical protein D6714_05860 [Bacteroidota bacterium]